MGAEMGVVQGGWEFVIAAYAVTATVLVGYTVSLLFRSRAEAGREQARSDMGS